MFCSKCGKEIMDNEAKFCAYCGVQVTNDAQISNSTLPVTAGTATVKR